MRIRATSPSRHPARTRAPNVRPAPVATGGRWRPAGRVVVAVVVGLAGLSAAACGGDEPDTDATTSMATATSPTPTPGPTTPAETTPPAVTPTSPTAPTTASAPSLPTPTGPATPPPRAPSADVTFAFTGDFPPVEAGSGAHGSGCAPGPGMLPDGTWFGFGRDLRPNAIEFDLACFYTGAAAAAEAAARGLESPPPNDYLIVNDNPTLRTVPVAADAQAWRLVLSVELVETTYADFRLDAGEFQDCPGDFCLLWLYVNDGAVTEVVSQYVP
jgi:hypothetical protein